MIAVAGIMFLRGFVLDLRDNPQSRFGVHGMRDVTGMIAELVPDPVAVTLCRYRSGYARVLRDGRDLIVISDIDVTLGRVPGWGATGLVLAAMNGRLELSGFPVYSPESVEYQVAERSETLGGRCNLWVGRYEDLADYIPRMIILDRSGRVNMGGFDLILPDVVAIERGNRFGVLFRGGRVARFRDLLDVPGAKSIM